MGSSSCLLSPNNSPIKGVAVRAVIIPLVVKPPVRPFVAKSLKKNGAALSFKKLPSPAPKPLLIAKGAANKLDLSTWAENPANAAAVAAGDFSYKNIGAGLVNINGQLTHVGTTKQGGDDTNLGLNKGETITIIDDTGKTVGLTGGEHVTNTYTTNTSNLTENIHNITEGATNYYYGMGGGGNKTIIATPPPPSKTAKEQQIKEPTRIINQAPKRDQYNKIRGRGPTQIPGAGGGLSIPVG